MRKLLLSFMLSATVICSRAQESTPTKEQTTAFLQQNILSKKIHCQFRYTETGTKWDAVYFNYSFIEANFDGCILKVKYSRQRTEESNYSNAVQDPSKITELVINFAKVESISYSAENYKFSDSDGDYMVTLIFKEQQDNGRINEITLPFLALGQAFYDGFEKREEQVYKAFNHLRKLCGAPEPIRF